MITGITGYAARLKESKREGGKKLHQTDRENSKKRYLKKLTGKSEWFPYS